MTDAETRDQLEAFLRKHCGEASVSELEPLAGGASRKLFGFSLRRSDDSTPEHLVLRMDPDGGAIETGRIEEFNVLVAAADAGVTVPAVHWVGEAADGLGGAFIVMDRVRGQAIARKLLRDEVFEPARAALPAQLAGELARIHACEVDHPRLQGLSGPAEGETDAPGDGRRYALAEIEKYRALLTLADGDHPRPAIVLGARWLARNAPSVARPCLVHGDFRIGNVMYDEKGLTSVLDWELAHLGDPLEDLGWLSVRAWRFGADDRPVGGLCSRERLLELYEQASGAAVDPTAYAYWEIFGNWRWAVICVLQAAGYRAGRYPNVELASLGRRVAEVESEMLTLMVAADGAEATQDPPAARAGQADQAAQAAKELEDRTAQDRPSAVELLESVGAFIREQARPRLTGAARFHALVAENVLKIVARELEAEPAASEAECRRLSRLLGRDEPPPAQRGEGAIEMARELCSRIEAGEADGGAWRGQLLDYLRESVRARLAVDNPDFDPDAGHGSSGG